MKKELLIITICAALLFLFASESYGQRGMTNTQSYSDVLRDTNPPEINALGRIRGNEVPRARFSGQIPEERKQYDARPQIRPQATPTINPDPENRIEEF